MVELDLMQVNGLREQWRTRSIRGDASLTLLPLGNYVRGLVSSPLDRPVAPADFPGAGREAVGVTGTEGPRDTPEPTEIEIIPEMARAGDIEIADFFE